MSSPRAREATPVYHVLTPLHDRCGHALLVDRGMVPKRRTRSRQPRRTASVEGETPSSSASGARPTRQALFTPAPDTCPSHLVFARPCRIAAADHSSGGAGGDRG